MKIEVTHTMAAMRHLEAAQNEIDLAGARLVRAEHLLATILTNIRKSTDPRATVTLLAAIDEEKSLRTGRLEFKPEEAAQDNPF